MNAYALRMVAKGLATYVPGLRRLRKALFKGKARLEGTNSARYSTRSPPAPTGQLSSRPSATVCFLSVWNELRNAAAGYSVPDRKLCG